MKIYNCLDLFYKKPFGAVKTNEKIKIRIAIESNKKVSNPCLCVCQIDKWNEIINYPLTFEKEECSCKFYSVEFNILQASIYFYFFKINIDGFDMELKRGKNHESVLSDSGDLFQLTVYDKESITEESYKGGIIYQIFPDRFCSSGIKKENVPSDRIIRKDWEGIPEYSDRKINNDYFEGDLRGITFKLDYLKELGVTAIYLNPIFEAHSNHRYNTANYFKIDPLLGTELDFQQLCEEAKKHNIVIILDGVFNHTGSDSIYFNKNKRYDTVGAFNSKDSEYYKWYNFNNYPNDYRSWWGIETLPEIDKKSKVFWDFVCGENGVIHKWLKAGAYGFRLDVADELDKSFLEEIKKSVIKYGGKILIGEVWEDASVKRSYGQLREYLRGYQLDATMNYPFKDAILNYIRYGSADFFFENVMSIVQNYPKEALDSAMNMLSTHDTERAITKIVAEEVNDHDRNWQVKRNKLINGEYIKGVKLFKLATTIQYFLPGIPSIYYGDEAGLFGYSDPFNRICYPWGKEDQELIKFFKQLGRVRIENDVLKKGSFKIIYIDTELCIFERFNKLESIIVCINRSDNIKILYNKLSNIYMYEPIIQIGKYKNDCLCKYSGVVLKKINKK